MAWGPWGPSRPGLITEVSQRCVVNRFISFPKTPWNEAGVGWCPGSESGEETVGGAWGQEWGADLSWLHQLQPHLQPQS